MSNVSIVSTYFNITHQKKTNWLISFLHLLSVAPVIRIPSVSVTGTKGSNVTLQCSSESSPIADHSWLDQNGKLIGYSGSTNLKASTKKLNKTSLDAKTSSKYTIQLIKTYHFKVTYQLTLTDLDYGDTGRYICHVNNTLGFAKSSIFLQGKLFKTKNISRHGLNFHAKQFSWTG